jgi:hypothetical protein
VARSDTGGVLAGEGVRGTLVGPDGAVLPFTSILCCQPSTCAKAETDRVGAFTFDIDEGTAVAVKTHHELLVTPRLAAALVPAVAGARGIDVGEVYVPDLPPGTPLERAEPGPQTLQAGDGLSLTVVFADLTPDLGVTLYDFAARRLPAPRVPRYEELGEREVLGVWAAHPFATRSDTPMGIAVPVALADGTAVEVFSVSHLDGRLSDPVAAEVSGGMATTLPGEGLEWLTHVVVAAAP